MQDMVFFFNLALK